MALAITATDQADGTGITVTVSGVADAGNTITAYTQNVDGELGGATWTSGGTRLGNGTIDVGLSDGFYWIRAEENDVAVSGNVLNANFIYVRSSDGAKSTYTRCLEAVQARIQGLGLTDIANGNIIVQKLPWVRDMETNPRITISTLGAERMNVSQGTNVRDDIGYPVLVTIYEKDKQRIQTNQEKYLLWRQRVAKAFRNQPLVGVTESIQTIVEPGQVVVPQDFLNNVYQSPLLLRCVTRETRGV